MRRVAEMLQIGRYDLVLLYREAIPLGPPIIESFIARRGIPIVYDFDDAIFLPNVSEANKAFGFLKDPGRVASIVRRSTHVIVGNDFLGEFARRHSRAVTVIPTAVDTDRFVPRPDLPRGGPPVVGWIGSPTTFPYLERLVDVLRKVAEQHQFVLRVSGAGRPISFPGLQVEDVPWSLPDEVRLFNTCDIGVYPLTDDDWARGKCGFKAIQCMACGVPVVASAVGVNREIIQDGGNSFLASTPGEWVEKLGRLLSDTAVRARMASAGRRTIEERLSLHVTTPRVAAVLHAVAGSVRLTPLRAPSTPSASAPGGATADRSFPSAPSERIL
jgi:glycosyltransferase involved in cell wall biosynthesis